MTITVVPIVLLKQTLLRIVQSSGVVMKPFITLLTPQHLCSLIFLSRHLILDLQKG